MNIKTNQTKETMTIKSIIPKDELKTYNEFCYNSKNKKTIITENIAIKPISKNNVILKKGDECIFSTLTYDYPNLEIDQKITIADVFDNGVVRVDNGTNIQVNVLANQIDKI